MESTPLFTRIILRWLPFALLTSALCGLIYLAVQQVWRQAANDPQIQMARDIRATLERGAPLQSLVSNVSIDVDESAAPFVMILDDEGGVLASSGRVHGRVRGVPRGVLEDVRQRGESRVTWQPDDDVRIATVILRRSDPSRGFVLVGRSLQENQRRIGQFKSLMQLACLGLLAALFLTVALSEYAVTRRAPRAPRS